MPANDIYHVFDGPVTLGSSVVLAPRANQNRATLYVGPGTTRPNVKNVLDDNAIIVDFDDMSDAIDNYNQRFLEDQSAGEQNAVYRGTTLNNTPTEIFVNGVSNNRIAILSGYTYTFSILITALRTDGANESAGYRLDGVIDNQSGTTALVGSVIKTVIGEDTAGWDVAATADNTNDALVLTVTGSSATVKWFAKATLIRVN